MGISSSPKYSVSEKLPFVVNTWLATDSPASVTGSGLLKPRSVRVSKPKATLIGPAGSSTTGPVTMPKKPLVWNSDVAKVLWRR